MGPRLAAAARPLTTEDVWRTSLSGCSQALFACSWWNSMCGHSATCVWERMRCSVTRPSLSVLPLSYCTAVSDLTSRVNRRALPRLQESARILVDLAQANGRADHSFQDLKEIMETWRCGRTSPGIGVHDNNRDVGHRLVKLSLSDSAALDLACCLQPHPQAAHAQRVGEPGALAGRAGVAQPDLQHRHQLVRLHDAPGRQPAPAGLQGAGLQGATESWT